MNVTIAIYTGSFSSYSGIQCDPLMFIHIAKASKLQLTGYMWLEFQ